MPPFALLGAGPFVDVAVADGVVTLPRPFPQGGGESGGGDEIKSAAITTDDILTVTTVIQVPTTIPNPLLSPPGDARDAPPVRAGNTHTLLLMTMLTSDTNSARGCDHASEELQGARQLVGHPPPPPAVVVDGAAQHGGGRPTAFANAALATLLPRPGPASLLPSPMRPQHGHI